MREARGWSVQDLVDKSGLSDKSINNYESRKPPSFVRAENADAISTAFDLKLTAHDKWPSKDRWITWVPHTKSDDVDADEPHVHQVNTLSRHAKMERDQGLHAQTIQTSAGPADLLGLDRLNKIFTTPKLYAGRCFAVSGKVDHHQTLNSSAARKIDAVVDEGAIFRMTRSVAKRLPLYVSVFAPNGEITERLMNAYDDGERLVAMVRVVYAPPEGAWRGFFFIEAEGQRSKKFAFVVDKIVAEAA